MNNKALQAEIYNIIYKIRFQFSTIDVSAEFFFHELNDVLDNFKIQNKISNVQYKLLCSKIPLTLTNLSFADLNHSVLVQKHKIKLFKNLKPFLRKLKK